MLMQLHFVTNWMLCQWTCANGLLILIDLFIISAVIQRTTPLPQLIFTHVVQGICVRSLISRTNTASQQPLLNVSFLTDSHIQWSKWQNLTNLFKFFHVISLLFYPPPKKKEKRRKRKHKALNDPASFIGSNWEWNSTTFKGEYHVTSYRAHPQLRIWSNLPLIVLIFTSSFLSYHKWTSTFTLWLQKRVFYAWRAVFRVHKIRNIIRCQYYNRESTSYTNFGLYRWSWYSVWHTRIVNINNVSFTSLMLLSLILKEIKKSQLKAWRMWSKKESFQVKVSLQWFFWCWLAYKEFLGFRKGFHVVIVL